MASILLLLSLMGFKLCIVADDFTGAADSAVQFRRNGYTAFMGLSNWDSGIDFTGYDALVVSTETRFMDGRRAYEKVRDATNRCKRVDVDQYFKKIDSTIRGNIADEIAAVMDEIGYTCAIVAPAAPKNGRTVVSGHCLVDGMRIGTASSANDPFTPVHDSYVPRLFGELFDDAVGLINLQQIRRGNESFRQELSKLRSEGAKIVIADAETIDDLRVIASVKDDESLLLCGASGLAEAMTMEKYIAEYTHTVPDLTLGEIVFIIGSVSGTSKIQFEYLSRNMDVNVVKPDVLRMLENEDLELKRVLVEAQDLPPNRPIIIITAGNALDSQNIAAEAWGSGLDEKVLGGRISSFLGRIVAELFHQRDVGALFITGGDTAARVAESMGIKGIELLSEIQPGVPLGLFDTELSDRPVYIVSKAGGFGREDTLVRIIDYMTATADVPDGASL